MSYCCSTCGNIDRAHGFPALQAVVCHYGWSGLVSILEGLAEDPEVQESVAIAEAKWAAKEAKNEAIRAAEQERKALKRQQNATKRMFRPPYADNLVSTNPPQESLDFSAPEA